MAIVAPSPAHSFIYGEYRVFLRDARNPENRSAIITNIVTSEPTAKVKYTISALLSLSIKRDLNLPPHVAPTNEKEKNARRKCRCHQGWKWRWYAIVFALSCSSSYHFLVVAKIQSRRDACQSQMLPRRMVLFSPYFICILPHLRVFQAMIKREIAKRETNKRRSRIDWCHREDDFQSILTLKGYLLNPLFFIFFFCFEFDQCAALLSNRIHPMCILIKHP